MTLEFLTQDKLKELLPSKNDKVEEWYEAMTEYFPKFEIDTPLRVAAFIAQCGHESNGFTVLKENLNYSADALNKVFPKYFKNAGREAEAYHRKPEEIANVIYANRMGNGDTESGEGPHKEQRLVQCSEPGVLHFCIPRFGNVISGQPTHFQPRHGYTGRSCVIPKPFVVPH